MPKDLSIHFIDVNQGDSTFIVTPNGKSILVDGGGNAYSNVGKNILLPYVLDRGYTKIDVVIISHTDLYHCDGIIYLIPNFFHNFAKFSFPLILLYHL